MNPKSYVNTHTQAYVERVFAETLRKEGFATPEGNGVHWYRVAGEEIIQSVIFYTEISPMGGPIFLRMGYGIHPAYVRPVYPKEVYSHDVGASDVACISVTIRESEDSVTRSFTRENMVMHPVTGTEGLYTLTDIILPKMQRVSTREECYQFHIDRNENCGPLATLEQCYNAIPLDMINLILAMEDESRYFRCHKALERWTSFYEDPNSPGEARNGQK